MNIYAPRLLDRVDLTAPKDELETAVFTWACELGYGAVFTLGQLRRIAVNLRGQAQEEKLRHVAADLHLALGACEAREREPIGGWPEYVRGWEDARLQLGLGKGTEMDQLRGLQDKFGGILLNGRGAPFVLIIPCSDGRWIQMGWTTLTLLASSPLATGDTPRVLSHYNADEISPLLELETV
jgi:hypothetical protein